MSGRLTIRHLRLTVLTPNDHPEPEMFRVKIEDEVRNSLASRLSERLGGMEQDGVLRIKRLELDLSLQDAGSESRIAERLADAIADEILRARESSDRIVVYRDRAHFLGAFLHELVLGRAWQRWWFGGFESLRVLPLSAALRTALIADVAQGLAAFLGMPREEAATIAAALTRSDAALLMDAFAETEIAPPDRERVAAALVVAQNEVPLPPSPHDQAAALMLFLDVARQNRALAGPALAKLALALATLGSALTTLPESHATVILGSLAGGDMSALASFDTDIVLRLAPLIALPAALRKPLIETASGKRDEDLAPTAAAARLMRTPFGGLFLILPSLDLAGIEDVVAQSESHDEDLPNLIALFVMAACAGRRNFAAILSDPVWRECFGLPLNMRAYDLGQRLRDVPETLWAALEALGSPVAAPHDARFLIPPRKVLGSRAGARALTALARAAYARLARRLPGFSTSSAPFLFRNVLAVPASVEIAPEEWTVTLSRPPLDVLLSISGIANATIRGPNGLRICLKREFL